MPLTFVPGRQNPQSTKTFGFIRSDAHVARAGLNIRGCGPLSTPWFFDKVKERHKNRSFLSFSNFLFIYFPLAFLFSLLLSHHQLTRTHKVLGAKQHGITASSSFEIQPVFLHSSSLFCHTPWLLKLKDPKGLVRSCQLMVSFLLKRKEKEERKKRKTGKTHQFPFMRFLRSLNTFESSGSNRMSSSILLHAEMMVE